MVEKCLLYKCLILLGICVNNSIEIVERFDVDLEDILNPDLMPTALFLRQDDTPRDVNVSEPILRDEADFNKAYEMMGYHRKMMNEYQCNNFIVKQIMLEIEGPNVTLSRRLGSPADENTTAISSRMPKMISNEELLYDPGSSGYKKWLAKTTTLDDIYKQFAQNAVRDNTNNTTQKTDKNSKISGANRRQSYNLDDLQNDDYEEGEITGYAVQQPMSDQSAPDLKAYGYGYVPSKPNVPEIGLPIPYPTAGSKNGYFPTGHDGYEESYPMHTYGSPAEQSSKELSLKDVMEIALTTLAYLSFGMFILQVLMCITMDKSNNMMMMPMEAADGGDVEEIRRRKRSIVEDELIRANEVSWRVLRSIDALVYTSEDDGQCLYRILCENNRFARDQKDRQKYWMPLWGLGMSWFSGRMARPDIPINIRLGCLKASIFGLGGANCEQVYSKCDLKKMAGHKKDLKPDENYKFDWSV